MSAKKGLLSMEVNVFAQLTQAVSSIIVKIAVVRKLATTASMDFI